MEITKVFYRNAADVRHTYTGQFTPTSAGLVFYLSDNSQYFVPFHKVDGIEQSFTNSVPAHERYNKSLARTFYGG